jgi:hypothetical protein
MNKIGVLKHLHFIAPLFVSRLFYRNGDSAMAVAVQTEPAFKPGKPETLFRGTYVALDWFAVDILQHQVMGTDVDKLANVGIIQRRNVHRIKSLWRNPLMRKG